MAERGIEVSREAIWYWVIKFGPLIAANLRRRRDQPTGRWHLDGAVVKIGGRLMYLWRAVDDEGEVLDVLVQKRRNKHAALKLLKRLLRNTGIHPETIVTDKLSSYRAAMKVLHLQGHHRPGGDAGEQSGGELTPGGPKTGAKTAAVQVAGFSPEFPRQLRPDLQRIQSPAPI